MTAPLVVKDGKVQQEQSGEIGMYPYISITSGQFFSSASPTYQIQVVSGQLTRVLVAAGVVWDGGASVWDGGATTWVS